MIEVTFEEFEKNFDSYMDRIEQKGEEFLVRKPDGTAVVAVPVTDELEALYKDHNEAC
jgi:PHD/YefM family antitoxin component YafN of YafNO toxin-antitoxin module|tara:strand:- start:364 stop:537 length:174 start_codon:yes stop_codon:yes gene_type:complete